MRQFSLGAPQVDNDGAPVKPLNNPVDDFAPSVFEIIVDNVSLSLFQALHDDLLGGLSRNPSESVRIHFDAQAVSDFGLRIQFTRFLKRNFKMLILNFFNHFLEFERLHFPHLIIVDDFKIILRAVFFPGGRLYRFLKRPD